MEWLIRFSDDYRDIKINEKNLAQYPSDADIELSTVDEAVEENDKKSKNNDNMKQKER